MEIYTIGFTRKTAKEFFQALRTARVKRLVDVRLRNKSQLAGFAKQDDLAFFLDRLCGIKYVHEPLLTPTESMLSEYRKGKIGWEEYESKFRDLIAERKIEDRLGRGMFRSRTVLLCSEALPKRCHRRLVAEYLQAKWPNVKIVHL